jgi:Fe-S-cluster containining protein
MARKTGNASNSVTSDISVKGDGWELSARVTVPTTPTDASELLPLARAISDSIVRETSKVVERSGEAVSCKANCGACCRHLVAISEVEARRIGNVVNSMPEPRKSEILSRFADARVRLESEGMLERLLDAEKVTGDEYGPLALAYFQKHIACPFLENESCSIYSERPITCREYLVMSPPEHCSRPEENNVRRVDMPLRVFNAIARWQSAPAEHFKERWVPLILAPEWAEQNPAGPPDKSGLELLKELLHHLSVKEIAS